MDKFDLELIQKEISQKDYKIIENIKITKRLIDKLMNKYNTCSYCVNFYDAEQDINSDEERKQFNNWTDYYSHNQWGLTNYTVRKEIRYMLNKLKLESYEKGRFYYLEHYEGVDLYFYGRDLPEKCDYWISFYNEEETYCLISCRRNECREERCKRYKGEI